MEKKRLLPEKDPDYRGPIGAIGYGLDGKQQREAAELFDWERRSLESNSLLGGPVENLEGSNCW